jgi:hypothetical protein
MTIHSTRRAVFFGALVLFAGSLAVTAFATSIPSDVIVDFFGLEFSDGMDYGSGVYTQGDFTITLSQNGGADWIEQTEPGECFNNGECLNAEGDGFDTQTVTIQTTSGNTFNFVSFWDLNLCGGQVVLAQGYLNGVLMVTQNSGFINDMTCGGTSGTVLLTGFENVNKVVLTSTAFDGFNDNFDEFVFDTQDQTITFNNPGAQSFGTAPTFTATATSGLTPTFTSTTSGVCTITSGGLLTTVATGTCTIHADQAGNASYLAAPTVSQSFSIAAVVPGVPTGATATKGNAQATVTFTAPAFNGGAAITGYTVTSSPAGGTDSNAGSTGLSHIVTGLTNGQAYTFTVTAANTAGAGSASTASNQVTPSTVPGAPTGATATAGNAQATVTFATPVSNGGASITGYTVISSPAGGTDSNAGSTGLSHIVTGLTNGQGYTFTVVASNTNGAGSASTASNQVTPSTVPGAPTGATATVGNAQATVTFTAPVSTGGSAITGYTVISSPAGGPTPTPGLPACRTSSPD